MEFHTHVFPNGIKLIHKQVKHTQVAHCCLIMNIGSRDERPEQQGIAHFWEHMAFKGTARRKAYHILSNLETVGGELNAYTTKEKICFHASSLVQHFERSADILCDIAFRSTFPEKEIVKERGVILEEMSMYLDDPAEAIGDEFDEMFFGAHPLGRNILGTRESVSSFRQQDFLDFIAQNLNTEETAFSSVSSLPFEKVVRLVGRHLADIPHQVKERPRLPFKDYRPEVRTAYKANTQAQCIMGTQAYSMYDPMRLPLFLLTNVLGGPGMNSRLSMELREKHGYVYDISAGYNTFQDCGQFSIGFACEPRRLDRCQELVLRELRRLREQPLGVRQLHTAKSQFMGQIAIAEDSNLSLMLAMGKSFLDKETLDSLEVLFQKIEAIEASTLQQIAEELLQEKQLCILRYLPEEEGPEA